MRIVHKCLLFLCLLVGAWLPLHAAEPLVIQSTERTDEIRMKLVALEPQKLFRLSNPDRLVVDLLGEKPPSFSLPKDYQGGLLREVRAGRFNAQTVRLVFELMQPVRVLDQQYRNGVLTVRIEGQQKPGKAKPASTASIPAKPAKPMIVIDAGHGGEDPGAIGEVGTQEKDVVLAFAQQLEKSLVASGKYRVLLTRKGDVFIPLRERVRIARAANATLFISLHADSAPNDEARGLSVYTLSEKASDAEAAALAERENKVDILGGMDLSHEREDVADILISLAQRETRNQSALLADMLVTSLQQRVRVLPNTHRFAGFAVLKAPDIPSVLIETGFLSHPKEEKLLKTSAYRKQLITGITDAVHAYFKKQSAM